MYRVVAGLILLACIVVAGFFLYPEQTNASLVRSQVVACIKTGEPGWRGSCFRDLANSLMEKLTLEEVLAALAEVDDEDGIKQQCHALVHYLGQNAYKESGSLATTFARCSSHIACGEGCYHGAVEGYIAETGDQLEGESIATICSRDFTGNEVNYRACVHGLGHAFMLLDGGDVLRSLPKCDFLSGEDRMDCYDGVFMENVFGAGSADHPTEFLKRDDPFYPCTIVEERYKKSCYASQVNLVMPPGPARYEVGAHYCNDVPLPYQAECYGSLGGDIVLFTDDPAEVAHICALAPRGEARDRCFALAIQFRSHGTVADPVRLGEICVAAEKEEQAQCFDAVGKMFEDWYPGKRVEKCAAMNAGTSSYDWCAGTKK